MPILLYGHVGGGGGDGTDSDGQVRGGPGSSRGQARKPTQEVDVRKVPEACPLIDPSQVTVTHGEIYVADPVLTPIGKTRTRPHIIIWTMD